MTVSGEHRAPGSHDEEMQTAAGAPGREPLMAIVLPAFNEEVTIAQTIRAFHEAAPDALIVVVDNNSTDATAALATEALTPLGAKGWLIREPRKGKGNAMRRAFHDVDADLYVMADADMTYPAWLVSELARPILDGEADLVVGNRLAAGRYAEENKRPFHNLGNRLVLGIVNAVYGVQLGDIMSGYRAMSLAFVQGYPIMVEGFQIEVDMTLHALDKRFRVLEIPVDYRDRPAGSTSKLSTFADGRRVLGAIARVVRHYRPMLFFGALGLVFGVAGLAAGVPVASDWILYRYIYHVPLAILATGFELLAALTIGIGLILDSVAHLERMSYERDLVAHLRRDKGTWRPMPKAPAAVPAANENATDQPRG